MNIKRSLLYGSMSGLLFLAGCGGGGSSAPQQATMTLKLSTSGTLPQGTSLAGIGVTLTLPAGVTINTDASGTVAGGVVTVAGVAAPGSVIAVYTPATGSTPATLALTVVSTVKAGFGTGEFGTVTCNLANGTSPKADEFGVSGFQPYDLSGNQVIGLTPGVL
jgi:hypothetical protein